MADGQDTPAFLSREEARAKGVKRYYQGPCRYGHHSERHVSNATCMRCSADRNNARYYANHEANLAKGHEIRAQTVERRRISRKAAYAADPEAAKTAARAWYRANPDKAKAARVAYRKANREFLRLLNRHYTLARRARLRDAEGSHTTDQIADMLQRQRFRCAACRKSLKISYHVDHVIPLRLGGSNDIRNLQALCVTCNCSKGGKHPVSWAQENGRLL